MPNQGNFTHDVHSANMSTRMTFLRKIFGILSLQLIVNTGIGALYLTDMLKGFANNNWYFWLAYVGLFIFTIVCGAVLYMKTEGSMKWILLAVYTILESVLIGLWIARLHKYYTHMEVYSFGVTLLVVIGLTIYTLQSSRDFSSVAAGLYAFVATFVFGGILYIIFEKSGGWRWSLLFIALISIFHLLSIIFTTDKLMHKQSPEDVNTVSAQLYYVIFVVHLITMSTFAVCSWFINEMGKA